MVMVKKLMVAVVASFVLGLPAYSEQIPAGTYTNSFGGTASLYDFSGTYHQTFGAISYDWTCSVDEKGKLTGEGGGTATAYTEYGYTVYKINATYNGTVKTVNNVTQVRYTVKEKGTVVAAGLNADISGNLKASVQLDPIDKQLTGTMSGTMILSTGMKPQSWDIGHWPFKGTVTVSDPNYEKQKVKIPPTPFSSDLPAGEDGSWKLVLNLTPAGTKYTGSGSAILARGQSYPVTVSGSYSSKSGASKLMVKAQKAMALTAVVDFQNAQMQFQGLKAKALGQSPHLP